MTEEQKKIKRYVNAIERNLKMPLKMKARINSDLGTEIHLRLEEGKSVDQVLSEMGTPKEVAERFNQEMKFPSKRKNFWGMITVCILGAIVLAGILGSMWFRFFRQQAVSIVGGADGPTSVFIAGKPDWTGYLISSIGFIFGCISAGLLCKYGKKAQKRSYVKCMVLSLVGLACAFVPFFFLFLENLQWIFYFGVTELALVPGLLLNLITFCCSVVFMRNAIS